MLHRPRAAHRWALGALLVGLSAWFAAFVARSSVVIDGERHFFLFDDALISMSYARNLAAGLGPVWTPGNAPVEGFTNPLWTALMVPAQWLPLDLHHRPLVIQVLGLVLLALTVWRVKELLCRHYSDPHRVSDPGPTAWILAATVSAFHYSLSYWSFLGMETPLMALQAVLAVHFAYDIVYDRRDRHLALFAVLAAAYLTRMDMALMVVLVLAWVGLLGGFRPSAGPGAPQVGSRLPAGATTRRLLPVLGHRPLAGALAPAPPAGPGIRPGRRVLAAPGLAVSPPRSPRSTPGARPTVSEIGSMTCPKRAALRSCDPAFNNE